MIIGLMRKKIKYFFVSFLIAVHCYAEKTYSPYVDETYPTRVYWGDTHLHTNLSVDSYLYGNIRLSPSEAYRFARGEVISAHNGMQARLRRPLDFLVVADHAENMGVIQGLNNLDANLMATPIGQRWQNILSQIRDDFLENKRFDWVSDLSMNLFSEMYKNQPLSQAFISSMWSSVTTTADSFNEPGKFSAFIGYEWSGPLSIHRVVVFKDGADKVAKMNPFSSFDSGDPEDLWSYLADYEIKTGGEALAITHNGNLTKGNMFKLESVNGLPLTQAYAESRARWEPLNEVTQIKGDSETHPLLSPDDEFADYETWEGYDPQQADPSLFQFDYTRSALKNGLLLEAALGVNPFKVGMIGSTDSHTSLATADENNFWGTISAAEPKPDRLTSVAVPKFYPVPLWRFASSGYAAVWAKENTRDALFDAMKRKEVYATTGPRISVRFFGGWSYEADEAYSFDLARVGYKKGVPMGGDLTEAPQGQSPKFLIHAIKDPDGANLDRVQVIKGWRDNNGALHEKVYNVALSDGRKDYLQGKAKSVGNTVNVKDASYTNTIGDPELAVVWQDPDFNKAELAFYYVRVLEIPTPRWTAYDAKFFDVNNIPEEIPMITQERAYTSPIWYSPPAKAGGE